MANSVSFQIKVDNIDKVIAEKNDLVRRAMVECGLDMERFAKEELYPDHGKVTGRLQNSITFATVDYQSPGNEDTSSVLASSKDMKQHGKPQEASVYVGTNVEYAPYIENGSSKRGAGYHYLKNSIQGHEKEYEKIIKRILNEGTIF